MFQNTGAPLVPYNKISMRYLFPPIVRGKKTCLNEND